MILLEAIVSGIRRVPASKALLFLIQFILKGAAMKNVNVILKFDEICPRDSYKLRRIEGTVNAQSMIRLLDIADLKANPREAKDSQVTEAIIESITETSDIHHFKTKGLLIAASDCEKLERNRFRLSFSDEQLEGVLDGGHNLLAVALYFLRNALPEPEKTLRGVKRWEQIHKIWAEHRDEIAEYEKEFEFLTPMEVIFPHDSAEGRDVFEGAILEIAQARNNNAQLLTETKDHKAGLYDALKKSMDPALRDDVEWKTNDGGRIKARDVVSLALIPLSKLNGEISHIGDFNPVSLYRNKGACVELFGRLMKEDAVTNKRKGDIRELVHPGVKSALQRMKEIPKVFDYIYQEFPTAYNKVSSGFGRIRSVRIYENGKYKKGDKKYLPKSPKTKFYQYECMYDFPDGFIMPIMYGMVELLEYKNGKVGWAHDPIDFLKDHLEEILRVYHGFITIADYDPQRVGKTAASYELIRSQVRAAVATMK